MKSVRALAATVAPESLKGFLDYYRFPQLRSSWGGPFNAQAERRAIFESIVRQLNTRSVVETGTFRGTTTELLRDVADRVVTIEASERSFGFARARFLFDRKVTVLRGDSRSRLIDVLDGGVAGSLPRPCFFYLDAHWQEHLPLAEELEIVFTRQPDAVVMIDDFQVPDDPGYAYDDYGPGKALTEEYIAPAVARFGLVALYPVAKSSIETGARRGCVVLASRSRWRERLLGGGRLRELQAAQRLQ